MERFDNQATVSTTVFGIVPETGQGFVGGVRGVVLRFFRECCFDSFMVVRTSEERSGVAGGRG